MHKVDIKRIIRLNDLPYLSYSDLILDEPSFLSLLSSFYGEHKEPFPKIIGALDLDNPQGLVSFAKKVLLQDENTTRKIAGIDGGDRESILELIDGVYDYWRNSERYLYYVNRGDIKDIGPRRFTQKCTEFATTVQMLYRDVYEGVLGHGQTVYRNIPAGGNAGMLYRYFKVDFPADLQFLNACPLMESVVIFPPFICSTKQNKRVGYFFEKDSRLKPTDIDTENMSGAFIRICDKKGLVYIDKEYQSFLVALGNLFKLDSYDEKRDGAPDFVLVFGTTNGEPKSYYYRDGKMLVGVCPKKAEVDYFGYMKKMVLTLYNLLTIDEGRLPIHGAGVEIHLKDGRVKNIVFLGDSGAGKSETLEALRIVAGEYIDKMVTIFDDMGTLTLSNDGKVYATGTETGAFVRLDDLDQGYSLRSLDRSVFLNIDVPNSRVVIPIETFETAKTPHGLDMFLLADNFTDTHEGIKFYEDPHEAMNDFVKAERMALGTTSEKGLTSTFLGNPFGPMQERDRVMEYLPDFFKAMAAAKVPLGRLYTRLSLEGMKGPETGARALLKAVYDLR